MIGQTTPRPPTARRRRERWVLGGAVLALVVLPALVAALAFRAVGALAPDDRPPPAHWTSEAAR
jgi:hypothetical protein